MARYEIYVGGPGRGDYSRSQYPAKAFDPADAAFISMPIASHKGPSQYALTRVLDFGNDHALMEFVRNQLAAGAPIADGDTLGAIVIPANTLFYGVHTDVETPANGAVVLTLSTRAPNSIALGTVAGGAAGSSFRVAGEAAGGITAGAVNLGVAQFANVPRILDVTITSGAANIGKMRVAISPLLSQLKEGQY